MNSGGDTKRAARASLNDNGVEDDGVPTYVRTYNYQVGRYLAKRKRGRDQGLKEIGRQIWGAQK